METAKDTIKNLNASGGFSDAPITSGLSPTQAQDKVQRDIQLHESGTNTNELDAGENTESQNDNGNVSNVVRQAGQRATSAVQNAGVRASRVTDRLASQRTPGGTAALVIVLLLLVFFLIPVDKSKVYTRAQLMLKSLLGQTRLTTHRTVQSVVVTDPGATPTIETHDADNQDIALSISTALGDYPELHDPLFWDQIANIGTTIDSHEMDDELQ